MTFSEAALAQLKLSLSEANELLDFLGPWSALTQYDVNDVVTYEGSSYVALTVNINVVPGTAPTIWILLAAAGEGTELNFTGPYSTTTAYDVNDVATYNGSSYVAIASSTRSTPPTSPDWVLLAQAGATGPAGSGGGIIVFSSGATTKAAVVASPPSVMGFGVLIPITTVDQVQFAQCAFPVPSTGKISNLQASVDLHLAPSTGQDALTYTFTIYDSPGGSGWNPTSNEYMTTLMTVDLNIPMIGGGQFTGGTYASFTNLTAASAVNVTAGDRLVLVLNSNGTDPAAIDDISFGATLTYSY